MTAPSISVVATFYNRPHGVRPSLQSVLAQTKSDWECVIVDDGSSDGTVAEIEAFLAEAQDGRFRFVRHAQNRGVSGALRTGIAQTTAEVIVIQEAGDISLPDRFARQYELLNSSENIGLVGCYFENFSPDGKVSWVNKPLLDQLPLAELIQKNRFAGGEIMFERAKYESVGGYRPAFYYSLDYDLILRMAANYTVSVVPELLYRRVIDFSGISFNPDKFYKQTYFMLSAKRLAAAPPAESAKLYADMLIKGPEAIISHRSTAFQSRLVRGAFRSLLWGDIDGARGIAGKLENPLRRAAVKAVVELLFPITPVLRKGILVFRKHFGAS